MKTETVEEFIKRGGRVNYLSKAETSPGKEETRLRTKLLSEKWPKSEIGKTVVRRNGTKNDSR